MIELEATPAPFDTNVTHVRLLRRRDAAAYVRMRWGFPCSNAWLAKLACVGGGPRFLRAGRFPIYHRQDLDIWAQSRMSKLVHSTSELSA